MIEGGFLGTLEGGEGSGKTGVLNYLRSQLERFRIPFSIYHDPGDTIYGKDIREMMLHGKELFGSEPDPRTKIFAYGAARAQLAGERIRPDLDLGKVVLVDRFIDSTTAIQGYAEGQPLEGIRAVNDFAIGAIRKPDLTILLDVPAVVGLWRKWRQGEWNEWEQKGPVFHERVRRGFLTIAREEPGRVAVVRAWARSIPGVQRVSWAVLSDRLRAKGYDLPVAV